MIIPPNSSRWLAQQSPVTGLSERELENPEGLGYDLRIDEIFEIEGIGHLGNEVRNTPSSRSIGKYEEDQKKILHLEGGRYYLAKTIESVSFSENLGGLIFPRSTLFRSGVILQSSVVPAGYRGPLTFGIAVWLQTGFKIELGARFAHIVVVEVGDGATQYKGQWNGGRVTVDKPEQQK